MRERISFNCCSIASASDWSVVLAAGCFCGCGLAHPVRCQIYLMNLPVLDHRERVRKSVTGFELPSALSLRSIDQ